MIKKYNRLITTTAIVFLAMFCTEQAYAQPIGNHIEEPSINWQNLSFEQNGVYGAEINKAHDLLRGRKSKKSVIVAILCSGMDIEHEDLQGSIWQNPKEKLNGKDDNKNWKIDDIHGWNFLGNPNGGVVEKTLSFADREFLRLKDKYSSIQTDSVKYYIPDKEETKLIQIDKPENIREYAYFTNDIRRHSSLAGVHGGLEIMKTVRIYVKQFDKELREKHPDKEDFLPEDLQSLHDGSSDFLRDVSLSLLRPAFMVVKEKTWNNVRKYIETIHKDNTIDRWDKALAQIDSDDREIVGDNPYDIQDTKYGNNILLTESAGKGTLYAGIIAAQRANGVGIDGVSDNTHIMVLRTEPASGDAFPKDIANAIRYAVDNGADIIQLSTPWPIAPVDDQRKWVSDALLYAESKNVLIVQPVSDSSCNTDETPFFPDRNIQGYKVLDNMITVAASDHRGNPLLNTNFGKESVDLYAPGNDIYSTYMSDTYRTESGSATAASLVTGVAALIKCYFPNMTAKDIRELIINNVTDRRGVEVEKQMAVRLANRTATDTDLVLFNDLCTSSGILNAAKTIEAAINKKQKGR